jgi:hypothetical protein
MERHFGPVRELALTEIVPALDVAIHVIPPNSMQDSIVLFTTGMSDEPQNVPEGREEYRYTELFLRLPADWPLSQEAFDNPDTFWPFKWLRQIAGYPRQNDTWLGGPYTIIATDDPPVPLASNTKLSCLLLLRERGEEGTIVCADGRNVILYTMLPIYTEERDLEMSNGMRELLTRFQARGVPTMVDLHRSNVARGSQPPSLPPSGPRLLPKQ